jgi:hypothetical protein
MKRIGLVIALALVGFAVSAATVQAKDCSETCQRTPNGSEICETKCDDGTRCSKTCQRTPNGSEICETKCNDGKRCTKTCQRTPNGSEICETKCNK